MKIQPFTNVIFKSEYWIVSLFLILYLFLPTANSTLDSYYYAYCVKYDTELFFPHHLLYNAFNYLIYQSFLNIGFKFPPLEFMKAINAIFAASCLWILYKIILLIPGKRKSDALILVFFSGSSYGIMRFATESETYIIPVFFSLLGSFFYAKYKLNPSSGNILWCGLFSAIACLFHQIHFFWWLGFFISLIFYSHKAKDCILFLLMALLVPLCYLLVLCFSLHITLSVGNLINFVFSDYVSGAATSSFGLNNILLGIINLFRTFFQVHGKIFFLIKKFPLLLFPAFISIALFINTFLPAKKILIAYARPDIAKTFIFIFMLQFAFAIYAVGNAEFMVMLPFLISIIFSFYNINNSKVIYLGSSMLVWNLSFGIIPDRLINYSNEQKTIEKIKKDQADFFLLKNGLLISNMFNYLFGKYPPNLIVSSPNKIKQLVRNKIARRHAVITDLGNNPSVMSRAMILEDQVYKNIFMQYTLTPVDSFMTFYGYNRLYRIDTIK